MVAGTYPTWESTTFLSVTNQHSFGGVEPKNSRIVDTWISELRLQQIAGKISRPTFIAAYGTGANKGQDNTEHDPNGYFYHDGAWVPFFFAHAAGSNLIWQVNGNFQPNGVTAQPYRVFGAFIKGELAYLPDMSYSNPLPLPDNIKMGRYQSEDRALLLFRDWDATFDIASPAERKIGRYTLNGLSDGDYRIEFWNTMTGQVVVTHATTNGDLLTFNVPPFHRALAVKVYKEDQSSLTIEMPLN